MKYRNRYTGTVVEPSAEVAALNYAADPTWEEVIEEQKTPAPPIKPNGDPPDGQENSVPPSNGNDDPPSAQKNLDPPANNNEDPPEGQPFTNGKEEPECSQPEQTATSQSNTPTDISPSTTSPKASSKKGGQTSAKEKKKSDSA